MNNLRETEKTLKRYLKRKATDKFTGSFAGSTGSFDVLGAELSEDTAKFDLGVEVSKDNGVFYNLGGTLRVGSDNTRDYGVKLGAGYKF